MAQYHAQVFRTLGCRKSNGVRDWICTKEEVHNSVVLIVGTVLIWFSTAANVCR
ncbi:hypothetical protein [Anabaena azotica]|uniref:Uncharacterized protein n=1 Tax=Anabaena azotica FACHB-119 TaxID=947527 RepID=A0ABR8DET1_9NOST|nr:hypothetical protein [Anabaena azotica]MBD2504890.1 hypothetical protein [Anabaena azotica FACHB-119]